MRGTPCWCGPSRGGSRGELPEPEAATPLAAALLFAIYPLHPNAVIFGASFATLFAATFLFGATLFYLRFRESGARSDQILALGLFALGLGSYEAAAVLPAVLAAWDHLQGTAPAPPVAGRGISAVLRPAGALFPAAEEPVRGLRRRLRGAEPQPDRAADRRSAAGSRALDPPAPCAALRAGAGSGGAGGRLRPGARAAARLCVAPPPHRSRFPPPLAVRLDLDARGAGPVRLQAVGPRQRALLVSGGGGGRPEPRVSGAGGSPRFARARGCWRRPPSVSSVCSGASCSSNTSTVYTEAGETSRQIQQESDRGPGRPACELPRPLSVFPDATSSGCRSPRSTTTASGMRSILRSSRPAVPVYPLPQLEGAELLPVLRGAPGSRIYAWDARLREVREVPPPRPDGAGRAGGGRRPAARRGEGSAGSRRAVSPDRGRPRQRDHRRARPRGGAGGSLRASSRTSSAAPWSGSTASTRCSGGSRRGMRRGSWRGSRGCGASGWSEGFRGPRRETEAPSYNGLA